MTRETNQKKVFWSGVDFLYRKFAIRGTSSSAFIILGGCGLLLAFLVLYPITYLFTGSFLSPSGGFTLEHYKAAYSIPFMREAIVNTVLVAVGSTILACLGGTFLAWIANRTDTPGASLLGVMGILPFVMPPLMGSLAWVLILDPQIGLVGIPLREWGVNLSLYSYPGLIWVVTIYVIPYVFVMVDGSLKSINHELEEAAAVTGVSVPYTVSRITLPLVLPAIAGGTILAFIHSITMFGVHAIIGLPANIYVLTTAIYRVIGDFPPDFFKGSALAMILVALTALALYMQGRALGGRSFTTLSGKGFRTRVTNLGPWRYVMGVIVGAYMLTVVVLPWVVLLLQSFLPWGENITHGALGKLTLENYRHVLFEFDMARRAIVNSFFLAAGASVLCTLLSLGAAFFIYRLEAPGGKVLNYICMLPLATPGVIIAVGFLWAYMKPPIFLYGTYWILLVAYITREIPVGIRAAAAAISQVHRELEESARVCGVGEIWVLSRILIPLVLPSLLASTMLMFAVNMREFNASILLYTGGTEVLGVAMFTMWEDGHFEQAAVLAVLTLVITVGVGVVARYVERSGFRRAT